MLGSPAHTLYKNTPRLDHRGREIRQKIARYIGKYINPHGAAEPPVEHVLGEERRNDRQAKPLMRRGHAEVGGERFSIHRNEHGHSFHTTFHILAGC